MVMYHPELTVLRCYSSKFATCPVYPKKQAIVYLEVLRAHLETPIKSTAVYFRAHTGKSIIHQLSRCNRSVSKQRDSIIFFFEGLTNCVGSNANKFFFTVKCSCNIECMLVPLMPKVVSISR